MNVRQNYSSPSFGAIKGSASALVDKLGRKSLRLVEDQLFNPVADIFISEKGAKVVAKEGYSLPGELGKKGIREFEPHHYELGRVYNAVGESVYVNVVDNKFYDSYRRSGNFQIGACKTIADLAFDNAAKTGKIDRYMVENKTYEKIVKALMDMDIETFTI